MHLNEAIDDLYRKFTQQNKIEICIIAYTLLEQTQNLLLFQILLDRLKSKYYNFKTRIRCFHVYKLVCTIYMYIT